MSDKFDLYNSEYNDICDKLKFGCHTWQKGADYLYRNTLKLGWHADSQGRQLYTTK